MRRTPLARVTQLRREPLADVIVITGGAQVLPLRPRSRPKDTIPANVRRIVTERDIGLCVYSGKPAVHIHHRRLKGMGGASGEHVNCPCNLISLTFEAHELAHRNRPVALTEGLIVPSATPKPWLVPVLLMPALLHFEDGSGLWAHPSCDGEWLACEMDGGDAHPAEARELGLAVNSWGDDGGSAA